MIKTFRGKGEFQLLFSNTIRELSVSRDPQSLLVAIRRLTYSLKTTQVMSAVAYHQRLTHHTPFPQGCPKGLGEDSKYLPTGNDIHVLFSH